MKNINFKNPFTFKNYQNFLQFISKFSNVVYTLIQAILTTLGIPIALYFVIFVEIPRVQSGVSLFDDLSEHSSSVAAVIVVALLVVEFLVHYLKEKYKYTEIKQYSFTFGGLGRTLHYVLTGLPKMPEVREKFAKSPAWEYEGLARLLRNGIIIISLVGTMKEQIVASDKSLAWYESIVTLIFKSNLEIFSTWVVGAFTAFILVTISTKFSKYVSIRASEALLDIEEKVRNSNVLNFYELVERLNSRVLKKLTNIGEDDKFIVDGKRVKFNDKWYNLNNASEKASFVAVLKELNDERD